MSLDLSTQVVTQPVASLLYDYVSLWGYARHGVSAAAAASASVLALSSAACLVIIQ